MKVYISGPITGRHDYNRPAFLKAADALAACGFDPINPHDVGDRLSADAVWLDYMRVDIKAMMDADAVLLLPDWHESKGASIEADLAKQLGIPVAHDILTLKMLRGRL
jgi:nucleoside 2-deoxyribosyltransferase